MNMAFSNSFFFNLFKLGIISEVVKLEKKKKKVGGYSNAEQIQNKRENMSDSNRPTHPGVKASNNNDFSPLKKKMFKAIQQEKRKKKGKPTPKKIRTINRSL